MVEKKNKTFQMHVNEVEELLDKLDQYHLEYKNTDDGFKFEFQNDNTIWTIDVIIIERCTTEEQLFMFNTYPLIHSFQDIQNRTIEKILWI